MIINRYPYTDMHELNLSWVIEQVQALQKTVDSITVILPSILTGCTYDAGTETLTFTTVS